MSSQPDGRQPAAAASTLSRSLSLTHFKACYGYTGHELKSIEQVSLARELSKCARAQLSEILSLAKQFDRNNKTQGRE